MNSKMVRRYYAECGRGFWRKGAAVRHEEVCKCWTNPKLRCCKSCKHYSTFTDYDDIQSGYVGEGVVNMCPFDISDEDWTPAHPVKATDLNINCPKWEGK